MKRLWDTIAVRWDILRARRTIRRHPELMADLDYHCTAVWYYPRHNGMEAAFVYNCIGGPKPYLIVWEETSHPQWTWVNPSTNTRRPSGLIWTRERTNLAPHYPKRTKHANMND